MAAKRAEKPPGREKLTTTLSREARHKLTVLRADLRLAGVSVSEGQILDVLIDRADSRGVGTALAKSARRG